MILVGQLVADVAPLH
jgi:hypothetical protein